MIYPPTNVIYLFSLTPVKQAYARLGGHGLDRLRHVINIYLVAFRVVPVDCSRRTFGWFLVAWGQHLAIWDWPVRVVPMLDSIRSSRFLVRHYILANPFDCHASCDVSQVKLRGRCYKLVGEQGSWTQH